MLGVLLIAGALGLSNFAAAIGIGLAGIDAGVRLRVGLVFGLFEATMPLLGLAIGRQFATAMGSTSTYIGGGMLIATGSYTVLQARSRSSGRRSLATQLGPLVLTGAALSIDNLVVGFALGTHKVSLVLAAVVIAVISVAMSLVGLELGRQLGAVVEKWSEEVSGSVLILVGVAVALKRF